MPPKSKISLKEKKSAQKEFTDREKPQESFLKALKSELLVLNFYGVGGVGKSSLKNHLINHHLKNKNDVIYSFVDFDIPYNRSDYEAIKIIRKNLKANFKDMRFAAFDTAYTVYKSKQNPQMQISNKKLPFLDEGSLVADVFSQIADNVGWAGTALNLANYIYEKVDDIFTKEIKNDLQKLNSMEHYDIVKHLPYFLAYDIKKYMKKNDKKRCIVFLDTYEALWESKRTIENEYHKDEWTRELIIAFYENGLNPLFVITGRDELVWDKQENDWKEDMEQHLLGGLSKIDAKSFLRSCNISNEEIQDAILKLSRDDKGGHLPFYLDLCVDIYFNTTNPTKETFETDINNRSIYDRFFRSVKNKELKYQEDELKVLEYLSIARYFDLDIFRETIKHFALKYSGDSLAELSRYSFINKDEYGYYTIHKHMKDALKNHLKDEDEDRVKEMHQFLFEYFDSMLKDIDVKNITSKQKKALKEALFHINFCKNNNLLIFEWFYQKYKIFLKSAEFNFLLEVLKNELKNKANDQLYCSEILNQLGILSHNLGYYKKALCYYMKSLRIRKKIFDNDNIKIGQSYNNIGLTYYRLQKYDKSLEHFNKSQLIKQTKIDKLSLSKTYSNIARLKRKIKKHNEAIYWYKKVLEIYKNIDKDEYYATDLSRLGTIYQKNHDTDTAYKYLNTALTICIDVVGHEHPYTAVCMTNMANFFKDIPYNNLSTYDLDKALPLYKKALEVNEKILGGEHPDTVTSYNNLAGLYKTLSDYDKALPLYKKALEISEKVLGEDHPDTAISYNNLAELYYQTSDYDKALPLYKKALEIMKNKVGQRHPDTQITYKNLASLYKKLDKQENIAELFEDFLDYWIDLDLPYEIDREFLKYISRSISLSIEEKEQILEKYDELSDFQKNELIKIFQEERERFIEIAPENFDQLLELYNEHLKKWNDMVENLKK